MEVLPFPSALQPVAPFFSGQLAELIFLKDYRPTTLPVPLIPLDAWHLVAFDDEGPQLFHCRDNEVTVGRIPSALNWSFVDFKGISYAYEISVEDALISIAYGLLPEPFAIIETV